MLLPSRRLSLAARARVVLDGLMVMAAAVTFSWYFVLGPTLTQGVGTGFSKAIATAYPLCDLMLIFCLLLLALRLLSAGFLIVVCTDSVFTYRLLQGTYATGTPLDVGWPLGYMLIGLAAYAIRLASLGAETQAVTDSAVTRAPHSWRVLLPYHFIPAVGLLLAYTWRTPGSDGLERGVGGGAGFLLVLILLRQVVAILENGRLYGFLHEAYAQLEDRNRETTAYAGQLAALNGELRATHDELAANNRALTEANERLERLATIDPLTGLPNHRAMVAALDRELERAHRYNQSCAVLFFDLDHFKALNDGYGHPAGDAALREVGDLVRASLRAVDTVGRWGGEEFVALLPQTDAAAALAAAEQVRAAVAAHPFNAGGGVRLTCSLGVAAYPVDAMERDGLVGAADGAMHAAKRLGRNQTRAAADPAIAALVAEGGRAARARRRRWSGRWRRSPGWWRRSPGWWRRATGTPAGTPARSPR